MSDEPDTELRRHFAAAAEPLAGADFTTQFAARQAAARGWHFEASALTAVTGAILGGLAAAAGVLRLKHARLMVMGAAAVTVWVSFL